MRRYFESLRPADVPAISFGSGRSPPCPGGSGAISLAQAKALLRDPLRCPQAQASIFHDRPPVLHSGLTPCLSAWLGRGTAINSPSQLGNIEAVLDPFECRKARQGKAFR